MGRAKQLLRFRGQTLLECVVDNALRSLLHEVVVVVGHQADRLVPLLTGRGVAVVRNPRYASGQSSSIRAGLGALGAEADAALFLLGDQPLITPEIIDTILAAYQRNPAPIVQPTFGGRRGNPVLFDRRTFPRLTALAADTGARVLFEAYAGQIVKVPVADPAIHFDIDTEQDYRRLLELESRMPGRSRAR
jgi:molybdenum cofactor cytidylyltransferase